MKKWAMENLNGEKELLDVKHELAALAEYAFSNAKGSDYQKAIKYLKRLLKPTNLTEVELVILEKAKKI